MLPTRADSKKHLCLICKQRTAKLWAPQMKTQACHHVPLPHQLTADQTCDAGRLSHPTLEGNNRIKSELSTHTGR